MLFLMSLYVVSAGFWGLQSAPGNHLHLFPFLLISWWSPFEVVDLLRWAQIA